jgi:predicted transposase YbfD/YdcC
MEYSTVCPREKENENGVKYEVGSVYAFFARVYDARKRRGVRYSLATLLVIIFLAKLSGEDRPQGMADWAKGRSALLVDQLHLRYAHMPHANTLRWVFREVIDEEQFERLADEYLQLHSQAETVQVGIDGKAMRGTIAYGETRGEHLLSLYSIEQGTVLAQARVDRKENEIVVAPQVVERVDLREKVVTGDAMQTQRGFSQQIIAAKGEYLFPVKDNQPKLHQAIAFLFAPDHPKPGFGQIPTDFTSARTTNCGHGRLEVRTLTASQMLNEYADWPGLQQVYQLERKVQTIRAGQVVHESCEVEYGISSLSSSKAAPARLLHLRRAHWGIEAGLHYCRDVTFHEDATRVTDYRAAHNLAIVNNLALGVLRLAGYRNIAQARRFLDADLSLALTLILAAPPNFPSPLG